MGIGYPKLGRFFESNPKLGISLKLKYDSSWRKIASLGRQTHMTVVSEWFWGSHPIFIGKKKFIVAIVLLVVLEVLVVVLNTQQLSQHASYNMQFWPIARSLILNTHFGWSEWVVLSATSDFRHMCQILNLVRPLVWLAESLVFSLLEQV